MKRKAVSVLTLAAVMTGLVAGFAGCTPKAPEEDPGVPVALVTEGQSPYVIVLSADADEPTQNAAKELQKYVKAVTGAELPICDDTTAPAEAEIVVGRTNRGDFGADYDALGADGYAVFTDGSRVVVAGGKRGCIYGVYALLSNVFGVGFYSNDCECVPSLPTVSIMSKARYEAKPFFSERMMYSVFYDNVADSTRMKLGMSPKTKAWGGGDEVAANGFDMHTINYLLNNSEDPKYHTYNKQPCVSCEENYNKILATALEWIANRHGTCTYINISQNDGPGGWCTCAECTNYNNLYGGGKPTGAWWYFINRISQDIHDIYPEVEVRTYAYEDTAELTSLDIGKNIAAYVSASNGGTCSNHPLATCERNLKNGTADSIRTWSEKLDKFYIYDYYGSSGEKNMIFPNLYAMRDNLRFYAECGAYAVITFGCTPVAADFTALRYYLHAHLLWDPFISEEDYEALIVDFLTHFYGEESGKCVKEYMDLFFTTYADKHLVVQYGYEINKLYSLPVIADETQYKMPENGAELAAAEDYASILKVENVLDTDFFTRAHDLFARAEALAPDDVTRDRVRLTALQVDYHELYLYYERTAQLRQYLIAFNDRFGTKIPKTQVLQTWYAMNRTLAENLLALGVTTISEKVEIEEGSFIDETKLPRDW